MECRLKKNNKKQVKLDGFLNNFQSIQNPEIRKHKTDLEEALAGISIKHKALIGRW